VKTRSCAATRVAGALMPGAASVNTNATGAAGDGFEVSAISGARLVAGFVTWHVSPQHGIAACIATSLDGIGAQQAAAAGNAVTKSTSAAAIAVAALFVIGVLSGFTVASTPPAVSVFR
jgi:hypothetical protein